MSHVTKYLKKTNSSSSLAMVSPYLIILLILSHSATFIIGIWDCLSSQQAVDFVRRQVAEGKELSEICEMMCEHCLAPDTSSGAGIGCDNMTILIVAILHGRTKEEWYTWVTDRVNSNYGYETPTSPPQLYAQSRLMSFRARREAMERRAQQPPDDSDDDDRFKSPFVRALEATGFVTRLTGQSNSSGISSELMFNGNGEEESDDEESGDEDFSANMIKAIIGDSEPSDATTHLKAQLDEFEKDIREEDGTDADGDTKMGTDDEPTKDHRTLQGEATSPPKPLPNGDASTAPVDQLKSQPHGDETLPVVKAEGLIDSSEDPLLKT